MMVFFKDLMDSCECLMKLSITNIDIASKTLCQKLVDVLSYKPCLQYLDISSCFLRPFHLNLISKYFVNMIKQLRDVNLSYNNLDFRDETSQEYKDSDEFLQNLEILFKHGVILNHFNASGMNFTHDKIKYLCGSIIENKMLMSLHLNDNGITSDSNVMLEILDIFGIQQSDLPTERNIFDDSK